MYNAITTARALINKSNDDNFDLCNNKGQSILIKIIDNVLETDETLFLSQLIKTTLFKNEFYRNQLLHKAILSNKGYLFLDVLSELHDQYNLMGFDKFLKTISKQLFQSPRSSKYNYLLLSKFMKYYDQSISNDYIVKNKKTITSKLTKSKILHDSLNSKNVAERDAALSFTFKKHYLKKKINVDLATKILTYAGH